MKILYTSLVIVVAFISGFSIDPKGMRPYFRVLFAIWTWKISASKTNGERQWKMKSVQQHKKQGNKNNLRKEKETNFIDLIMLFNVTTWMCHIQSNIENTLFFKYCNTEFGFNSTQLENTESFILSVYSVFHLNWLWQRFPFCSKCGNNACI